MDWTVLSFVILFLGVQSVPKNSGYSRVERGGAVCPVVLEFLRPCCFSVWIDLVGDGFSLRRIDFTFLVSAPPFFLEISVEVLTFFFLFS